MKNAKWFTTNGNGLTYWTNDLNQAYEWLYEMQCKGYKWAKVLSHKEMYGE
jgi:hypothetical protein